MMAANKQQQRLDFFFFFFLVLLTIGVDMMCGCVCVSVFMSYLLQLLDDRDGNQQLTDIFTFPCRRLVCFCCHSFSNKYILRQRVTLGFVLTIRRGQRAGNVWLHIEREMLQHDTHESLSLLGSAARRRPWQTLKSLLPNTIVQDRVEGTIVTFAHAPSCNVFTPSRTPDQTLK